MVIYHMMYHIKCSTCEVEHLMLGCQMKEEFEVKNILMVSLCSLCVEFVIVSQQNTNMSLH